MIKATATGGSDQVKPVRVKIVVCGDEQVSLVGDQSITYNMYRMDSPVAHTYALPSNWTSTDPDCPVNSFSVTLDTDDTVPASDSTFKIINDQTLWLLPSAKSEHNFFVKGQTVSESSAYKAVTLSIKNLCEEEP